MPVLNDIAGTPRVFYIGWYIRDAQRRPQVPRLTAEQTEAMELLEAIANDPAFYLEMDFQPGDVQLLNNARILHAREAFEDHDDPDQRRHLLRLWLAAHHFTSVDEVLQGGIPKQQTA
jgi:alpha-ketoglutarate-dependent taurine dioxygenase